MSEENVHRHHGKTSRDILGAEEILDVINLKSGDKFLDAGCGDGYVSIEASKLVGSNGKIFALDVYPESIEGVAKEVKEKGIENLEPILADVTDSIPLDDDSVDAVLMSNVLHGFGDEELETVLKNINRVIKKDGKFAVVEFRKVQGERGPPFDVRLHPSDVSQILSKHGYKVVKSQEIATLHYIVVGQKTD
ncbi:Methyltransferase type 11 [Methanobacterium lacus]|uniref:Methyltransferase type 11 n=1 Tax=Methanobacterium lacus (strain AL-21) TaxID=877455 RepID=F0TAS3_METLA|nr:class I SAM-dependent methyltransferase [Methanobacterium lacus]ADZ08949.1 Methyltransferase type 11 [Methanobacterium lacus]